nr:MAG TPA: hypothetical protein [Caudoviricetes sp.]
MRTFAATYKCWCKIQQTYINNNIIREGVV